MPDDIPIVLGWRAEIDDAALNRLHAESFDHLIEDTEWRARLDGHSLGWVCAHRGEELVGFVNVAWDGGVHAFLLDLMVARAARRASIGTELSAAAARGAREAGCEWLHVDFEGRLHDFYLEACGFRPTAAGVIRLT